MATDFQSLYVLASGMYYNQRKLEVISNNLANVNTDGFKKELLTAEAYPVKPTPPESFKPKYSPQRSDNNFVYPVMGKEVVVLTQGELKKTDNPLDAAIVGRGFFTVEVNGKLYYTRDGHFLVDKNGYLINQNGYPVMGENGKIYIGRAPLSSVRITKNGDIFVGTTKVGRLKIVDLEGVRHFRDNLYTGKPVKAKNFTVVQGYLEGSNVNPVDEMVRMIETVRAYETYANSIKTVDENNSKLINGILKA